MKKELGRGLTLISEAFSGWREDNAPRLGAALAYYTLFSLAPLLTIAVAVAGWVFGEEAARGRIVTELRALMGTDGAQAVEDLLARSRKPEAGIVATLLGLGTLLLGATGVFAELKGALNQVWSVEDKGGGLRGMLKDRLAAFGLVLVVGFLLLVSLAVSAFLSAAGEAVALGGAEGPLQLLNAAVSFAGITALFAVIFKFLPDTKVAWRDVWAGAAMTSALFTIGKTAIGLYLGHGTFGSTFGAAASVVVLVVWVYYAAQIFLFGAELTEAYARHHGSLSRDASPREPGRGAGIVARTPKGSEAT